MKKTSCASDIPKISLLEEPCCPSRLATSRRLCRYMNAPNERRRYGTESLAERDSDAFVKFQPQAPLAPLRDDVPLTEPHTGRLSAAARADLGLTHRLRTAPCDPRAAIHRPHTPSPRASAGNKRCDPRGKNTVPAKDESHSSRERPDPSTTSLLRCEDLKRDACTFAPRNVMDKALRHVTGYQDIDWHSKLLPQLSTLEKMADPVSQRFTLKRYYSRPEPWQTIGPHWNRHQIRASYYVKKPFSFTSSCPKSGQIPLYSGVIGSENMDNIDISEKEFIPLTVLHTVLPPDTPTAHRPTIPGYTGKALHDSTHTIAISQLSSVLTHQTTGSSSTPFAYGRQAPLSRMVITVPPGNPFL